LEVLEKPIEIPPFKVIMSSYIATALYIALSITSTSAFTSPQVNVASPSAYRYSSSTSLNAEKFAKDVTGEELEIMLQEWDQPLVLDAYATWCGPCLLMAPHFEEAAQELDGKVRFVKIDTDKEPEMANRLNIMGLPTLMYLDKFVPEDGEEGEASAVLKEKIEGALMKDSIVDLCNFHFFGGPRPTSLS